MIKRILVALDGSPAAEMALSVAQSLARQSDSELVLACVAESAEWALRATDMVERSEWQECADYLKSQAARLDPLTRVSTQVLEPGDAAPGLVEGALQLHADLIVVASHGRGGLGRLMLGSVAEEVARTAQVPTMIVGPRCTPPPSRIVPAALSGAH